MNNKHDISTKTASHYETLKTKNSQINIVNKTNMCQICKWITLIKTVFLLRLWEVIGVIIPLGVVQSQ